MSERRQAAADRRQRVRTQIQGEERRGRRGNRRMTVYDRRQRQMDRRQVYDEFWMGDRDRRQRIMDRRKKGGA